MSRPLNHRTLRFGSLDSIVGGIRYVYISEFVTECSLCFWYNFDQRFKVIRPSVPSINFPRNIINVIINDFRDQLWNDRQRPVTPSIIEELRWSYLTWINYFKQMLSKQLLTTVAISTERVGKSELLMSGKYVYVCFAHSPQRTVRPLCCKCNHRSFLVLALADDIIGSSEMSLWFWISC